MKTSMVPVGGTVTRFQRMVRDTAAEKGKEIELVIHGQETELDKRVIEQITDPLKHMIRNSIDHGIEMPDVRAAAGKPRKGTIWLNAYHQEGSIIIEVRDDGKGLDAEVIRKKAIEKGLIDENQKALTGVSTPDCRQGCENCGVCMDFGVDLDLKGEWKHAPALDV
jgi:two-component system chemotaxis sensor kinase CheA